MLLGRRNFKKEKKRNWKTPDTIVALVALQQPKLPYLMFNFNLIGYLVNSVEIWTLQAKLLPKVQR